MYLEKPKRLIIWNWGSISQGAHGQPNMQLMSLASPCSLELLNKGVTQGIRPMQVYLHKRCSADKGATHYVYLQPRIHNTDPNLSMRLGTPHSSNKGKRKVRLNMLRMMYGPQQYWVHQAMWPWSTEQPSTGHKLSPEHMPTEMLQQSFDQNVWIY